MPAAVATATPTTATIAATFTAAATTAPVALDRECYDYANDEHHNHEPNPAGDDEIIVSFFHKIIGKSRQATGC